MKRTAVLRRPKRSYIFRVVIEPDEDVYHAYCPALQGCHTWGYTYEEALQNIQEAVQCHVEALLQAGDPIPTEPDVEVKPAPTVVVNVLKAMLKDTRWTEDDLKRLKLLK